MHYGLTGHFNGAGKETLREDEWRKINGPGYSFWVGHHDSSLITRQLRRKGGGDDDEEDVGDDSRVISSWPGLRLSAHGRSRRVPILAALVLLLLLQIFTVSWAGGGGVC